MLTRFIKQPLMVLALLVGLAMGLQAQDVSQGRFEASGVSDDGRTESVLHFYKFSFSNVLVVRQISEGAGISQGTWWAIGSAGGGQVTADFKVGGASITDVLDFDEWEGAERMVVRGVFTFPSENTVAATYSRVLGSGGTSFYGSERGHRPGTEPDDGDTDDGNPDGGGDTDPDDGGDGDTDDDPIALQITVPADGTRLLPGQVITLEANQADATFSVSGAGELLDDNQLRVSGAGSITITATSGSESVSVDVRTLKCEVTEIQVLENISIVDAPAPHFRREVGAAEASQSEPAAIFMNKPLKLRVVLSGEADLAGEAPVRLTGRAGDLELVGHARVEGLESGHAIHVVSQGNLSDKVAIHPLDISWSLSVLEALPGDPGASFDANDGTPAGLSGDATPVRVYTSYQTPVRNIRGRAQVATKYHFEMACFWANNASENVGDGATSIAWNIDNRMRHYVHPKDFNGYEPPVAYYAPDSDPPKNYGDLSGRWGISDGQRSISSLYYPPLEPDEDYEEYRHYQYNYGWWLLDNPNYTGGRCNQQAALVCDIVGTLGIVAEVHYLQRVGVGKESNRSVRQYFYARGGSGPWNFHGIARVDLGDGSEWLYDGSFSSPPRRLNGQREWAESEGGPFIQKWSDWLYDDVPYYEKVPESDHPDTWQGVQ